MDRSSYDTTPRGCNATATRVLAPVATPATLTSLRRTRWSAQWSDLAAIDMACGFATDMKVHERRPEEGSS